MLFINEHREYWDAAGTILGGIGLGSAIESREERKSAERDQKRARAAEKRIQDIKAARERRAAVREAMKARADINTGVVASGVSGSSAAVAGLGTINTQLATNLSFLDQVKSLSDQSSLFQEAAAKHYGRAQDFSDLSNLSMQGASMFAAYGGGGGGGGKASPKGGRAHVDTM